MKQRRRIYYSAAQRAEIWDRWSENFGVCRDPFVSKMRNAVQRASKISRHAQIRVFQQYWREHAAGNADG